MKYASIPAIPMMLSVTAGYVDTAGYVALQGLFTAHVTGNFVTLGASLVSGSSGALAKLLALPTFCLVIVIIRWLGLGLQARGMPGLRSLMTLKVVLLAADHRHDRHDHSDHDRYCGSDPRPTGGQGRGRTRPAYAHGGKHGGICVGVHHSGAAVCAGGHLLLPDAPTARHRHLDVPHGPVRVRSTFVIAEYID